MLNTASANFNQSMLHFALGDQRSRSVFLDSKQTYFSLDDSMSELEPEFDIYTAEQADSFQRFSQALLLEEGCEKHDSEVSELLDLESRDQRANSGDSRFLLELTAAIGDSCDRSKTMQSTAASFNNEMHSIDQLSDEHPNQEYTVLPLDISDVKRKVIAQNMTQSPQLVHIISKLLDKEPLSVSTLESLNEGHRVILFNFIYMMYGIKLDNGNLVSFIEELSLKQNTSKPKKIRNEERIKYVFKRVNKVLLQNFTRFRRLEEELDSLRKGLMLQYYFGDTPLPSRIEDASPILDSDPLFQRIFKQMGLARADLHKILQNKFYKAAFSQVLDEEFVDTLVQDRSKKLRKMIAALEDDLYFSVDKSDVTVLSRAIKRLPWSLEEMNVSIDTVRTITRLF